MVKSLAVAIARRWTKQKVTIFSYSCAKFDASRTISYQMLQIANLKIICTVSTETVCWFEPSLAETIISHCRGYLISIADWHFFSSPEPKAHGWANIIPVTPASINIFKHLLLWNHWAKWTQISHGDFLGWGNQSLFKWSWSLDQDGCHYHIW